VSAVSPPNQIGVGVGAEPTPVIMTKWVGVKGEMIADGKKKPFTMDLVTGERPWDWLVSDFKAE
jgi:hypothetical protein